MNVFLQLRLRNINARHWCRALGRQGCIVQGPCSRGAHGEVAGKDDSTDSFGSVVQEKQSFSAGGAYRRKDVSALVLPRCSRYITNILQILFKSQPREFGLGKRNGHQSCCIKYVDS